MDLKTWDTARVAEAGLDWRWLDALAREVAKQGKTIYWNDGGLSWQMPWVSDKAREYFAKHGTCTVPLFATNFLHSFEENGTWGRKLADEFGTSLGLSVQDWHFIAKRDAKVLLQERRITYESLQITEPDVLALFQIGQRQRCRVYEVEATHEGMDPASGFMKGVQQFIREASENTENTGDVH